MTSAHTQRPTGASETDSGGHGDVWVTWGIWGVLLAAMAVTYTRLDVSELYSVSRDGLDGAASRVLVQINFPISLVAIAVLLMAMDVLDRRWWWAAGPAMVACAVTAWPGVVDDKDLDARLVNVIPALGVATAIALTVIATRKTSWRRHGARPFDRHRWTIVAITMFFSLPWIAVDLGFYLPDFGFITERPITGSDGAVNPAVHLGHHHGFDGALILISALSLSRASVKPGALGNVTTGFVSLMAAYGAINFVQDLWHEQIAKRGWVEWDFPNALKPTLTPIWVVILALSAIVFAVIRAESAKES